MFSQTSLVVVVVVVAVVVVVVEFTLTLAGGVRDMNDCPTLAQLLCGCPRPA